MQVHQTTTRWGQMLNLCLCKPMSVGNIVASVTLLIISNTGVKLAASLVWRQT